MTEIKLSADQENSLIDAASSGIVEALQYLQAACPELGPYVHRALLFEVLSNHLKFDGHSLFVVIDEVRSRE